MNPFDHYCESCKERVVETAFNWTRNAENDVRAAVNLLLSKIKDKRIREYNKFCVTYNLTQKEALLGRIVGLDWSRDEILRAFPAFADKDTDDQRYQNVGAK